MKLATCLTIFLVLAAALACGGDSEADITITPNLEERREGLSEEETLELLKSIMERRAEFIDGSAEVTIEDDGTLSVDYSGIADDIAVDLYSTEGDLAIYRPQTEGEMIICLTGPGEEHLVAPGTILYVESGPTGLIPECEIDDGRRANIAWEDADTGLGVIENLDISDVALTTESGPTLIIAFDEDGNQKLASISSQIIGLPMGIFVDRELTAGPKVAEVIQNGQIAIPGLTLRDARILRAQLRAGAIPAPFTITVNE